MKTNTAGRRKPGVEAKGRGRPPPAGPRRAEPALPVTDDLDEGVGPPLHGKVHPTAEMDDATPTLDDEHRSYHHHPNDAGSTRVGVDPDGTDAAADLAGDLGATFLEGATRGEDMSDLALGRDEGADEELPLILDESGEEVVDDDDAGGRGRQRPFEEPGALGQGSATDARPSDERPRRCARKA